MAPPFPSLEPWKVRVSTAVHDLPWDEFLRTTGLGQFQQSSRWACYRSHEGWNSHRLVLTGPAGILGGFQLLWKVRRGLRLGYVSKGPVASVGEAHLEAALAGLLVESARRLRLAAVVVQLPDESGPASTTAYERSGFIVSNPMSVIEATCLVDLRVGPDLLQLPTSSRVRKQIRNGRRRGVVIREGTEADLPHFFSLMTAVCRRLGVVPNPSSVEALQALWRAFAPREEIRLTFAECDGRRVAAGLKLLFGTRATAWKKGWDGTHDEWHPNKVLDHESLIWAQAHGFSICDYGSFDRQAAARHLVGELAAGDVSGRDAYHLGMGASPRLLPRAMILIANRLFRWAYRQSYGRVERRRARRSGSSAVAGQP